MEGKTHHLVSRGALGQIISTLIGILRKQPILVCVQHGPSSKNIWAGISPHGFFLLGDQFLRKG